MTKVHRISLKNGLAPVGFDAQSAVIRPPQRPILAEAGGASELAIGVVVGAAALLAASLIVHKMTAEY